jgi:inosose dehydratase
MPSLLSAGAYPWMVDARDRGVDFTRELETVLAALAAAGVQAWEPFLPSTAEAESLAAALARHGLTMPSVYANLRLHDARADHVIADTLAALPRLRALGVRFLVVNPEPIDWGLPLDKDDATLRAQARALEHLARELAAGGVELAYHTHAPEMRHGAREFHAMLALTDPALVGLCLDAHWIYRGCGNSQVALETILALYGPRIRTVHLRQSQGGVWSETLGPGDVDYAAVVATLRRHEFTGPLTLEQAAETGTPRTLSMPERERRNAAWARVTFDT